MLKNIVLLCFTLINTSGTQYAEADNWKGTWFPHSPNELDTNPTIAIKHQELKDSEHGIKMGVKYSGCDDGETNLMVDWYMNPANYTCLEKKKIYLPNSYVHPVHSIERIPPYYHAPHKCMNESIEYDHLIPTFGVHRPLWPIYGEYQFVPRQRWIHNLEHGAVVMLYHPCANKNEVNLLRNIVRKCLFKHIITPYNLLNPTRPLALVTWGHRLEMSKVSKDLAVRFIKEHALKGAESTYRNGQYDLQLLNPAKIISDKQDSVLCPGTTDIM